MNVTCFADALTRARLDGAVKHHVAADVSVVIAAKQEAQSIGEVIERTRRYANAIVVVVGRSTDGTGTIAEQGGARVMNDGGRGKGEALRRAIPHVRTPVTVFLDADGSHDPEDIPLLVEPILADRRITWPRRGCAADPASCTAASTSSCGSPAARSSPPASTGGSTAS
jgi:cellulose synthase/poly-beta-1,6-N-acetylglucosamine synthase-like glycosyltransferase